MLNPVGRQQLPVSLPGERRVGERASEKANKTQKSAIGSRHLRTPSLGEAGRNAEAVESSEAFPLPLVGP